jgi:putative membrane protein
MMHDGWMYGMGWFWLVVLVLAVGSVWLVARSIRRERSGRTTAPREGSADDVLEARFARGEIDEQEFRQRRRTLRGED